MNTQRRVNFGYVLVALFLVIPGVASYLNARESADHRQWVRHTYEVLISIHELIKDLVDAETGQEVGRCRRRVGQEDGVGPQAADYIGQVPLRDFGCNAGASESAEHRADYAGHCMPRLSGDDQDEVAVSWNCA